MLLLHRFISDQSGATTVSWLVLTAGVIAITVMVLANISVGVNTTSEQLHDDIVVSTNVSNPSFQAPEIENITYPLIGNGAETHIDSMMTYMAWLPDVDVCDNPVEVFSFETGAPMTICPFDVGVISVSVASNVVVNARPDMLQREACETPIGFDDFAQTSMTSCLPKPTLVLAAVTQLALPVTQTAPRILLQPKQQKCEAISNTYVDFVDAVKAECIDLETTVTNIPDMRYVYKSIAAIDVPQDCGTGDCQYARVPDPEVQHEQFAAAPALFSPAECENPPCRFERDVTYEPKYPGFLAAPRFAPAQAEVADVVANSLHPGFRAAPTFTAPEDCNDPPCVGNGPSLPSLPHTNVLGAPPT